MSVILHMECIDFPQTAWRLIVEKTPQPGVYNMAADEALLRSAADGKSLPTLRFYQWLDPTLTLGRGQPATDVDFNAVYAENLTVLRRMTGGTAVLNDDVISYSVTAPKTEPRLSGSVAESYRAISLALSNGLSALGISTLEMEVNEPEKIRLSCRNRSPVCFEVPSVYEITVSGKKLVGNSQMRSGGGVLQHGSIYLDGDIAAISRVLSTHPSPHRIRSRTITLRAAVGQRVAYTTAVNSLIHAFDHVLNIRLEPGEMQPSERAVIERLVTKKYGTPAWTRRL
ncbi:MAG: biotin/lipoate A/B protein ligase family protein [Anaerolineae bacterium]|nr:biotin/lipoate A/B protein ligase family protein [Anaerolineae bacterium]